MMKKYIQYNAAQYASTPVEVGSRPNSVNTERPQDDCSSLILDLSGKHGISAVSLATRQKWNREQDSALDLSNAGLHMVCPTDIYFFLKFHFQLFSACLSLSLI